jgi:hypothetical protein
MYLPAVVVLAGLAAGYAALCARLWGDPLARFHGVEDLTYGHAWTLHGQPVSAWIHRLTWQPARLIATMFQATLIPVMAAPWLVRGRDRIWWVSTAMFGLLYWLGSTSFSSYSPLPISERMVLPVLPGIIVLAALASDRALDRMRDARWRRPIVAVVLAVVLVGIFVPAVHVVAARLVRGAPEATAFAALRAEVEGSNRQFVLVCGEPRCVHIARFYFGLAPVPNLTTVFADSFAQGPRPERVVVRALVNFTRSPGARRTDPRLDQTGPIEALWLRPIVWSSRIRLYDAGDGARLWDALRAAR